MTHEWFENSGTTDRCERCGLIRFYEDERDAPSRRRFDHFVYGSKWGTARRPMPKCREEAEP